MSDEPQLAGGGGQGGTKHPRATTTPPFGNPSTSGAAGMSLPGGRVPFLIASSSEEDVRNCEGSVAQTTISFPTAGLQGRRVPGA